MTAYNIINYIWATINQIKFVISLFMNMYYYRLHKLSTCIYIHTNIYKYIYVYYILFRANKHVCPTTSKQKTRHFVLAVAVQCKREGGELVQIFWPRLSSLMHWKAAATVNCNQLCSEYIEMCWCVCMNAYVFVRMRCIAKRRISTTHKYKHMFTHSSKLCVCVREEKLPAPINKK